MLQLAVSKADTSKKLLAYILDIISIFLLMIPMFFVTDAIVSNTDQKYVNSVVLIKEQEDLYNLNLSNNESWQTYEKAIQDFYFSFKDKIEEINKPYSYIYVYNVDVLLLPLKPTAENFANELFQYKTDSEGKGFLVDEFATLIEGSGDYYERSLKDLFYNEYCDLKGYLKTFYPEYEKATKYVFNTDSLIRMITYLVAISILFLFIPLLFKYGETIPEKIFSLAKVNLNTQMRVSKWKLPLKTLILYGLPTLGIYYGSFRSVMVFVIGFMFISMLTILLNKNNNDLGNMILKIELLNKKDSEILLHKSNNPKEEYEIEISEPDYLEKLKSIDSININDPTKKDE